jgi:hypothetical protein
MVGTPGWVYTIGLRLAFNALRRRRRPQVVEPVAEPTWAGVVGANRKLHPGTEVPELFEAGTRPGLASTA